MLRKCAFLWALTWSWVRGDASRAGGEVDSKVVLEGQRFELYSASSG